jgi:cytochrome c oxidase cbb3-type subunit III
MAKVTDQSFDHDYDGIKEYDNPLPRWWLWLFVGTVLWGIAYVPYYHFGLGGKLPGEAYEEDMAAWLLAHPPEPLPDEDALVAMAADDPTLAATGQSIFASRCAACHAADGGGQVGPNLTDDYALHGSSRAAIVKTIHDGVPEKGMLSWKNQLSREQIYAAGLYVYGLRGTTPANPKPPEGDPIVDGPVPPTAAPSAAAIPKGAAL